MVKSLSSFSLTKHFSGGIEEVGIKRYSQREKKVIMTENKCENKLTFQFLFNYDIIILM